MKRLTLALGAVAASLILQVASAEAAATEKVLYSFCSQENCDDGGGPWAGVTLMGNRLYTPTMIGGKFFRNGTLAAVDISTGKTSIVYWFGAHNGDPSIAATNLINVNGMLYGASGLGGFGDGGNGAGTIFSFGPRVESTSRLNPLYSFCAQTNCLDGASPNSSLLYTNGVLYGMTSTGGDEQHCLGGFPGCGTAYSFNPKTGEEKVLYSFCSLQSCADGARPSGALIMVNDTLYGTTSSGGGGDNCDDMGLGCGNVFSLDPVTGTETVLHAFGGRLDGGAPAAGLLYVNGLLYGTTQLGGDARACKIFYGCGTVFSIDPATGSKTILHSFKGGVKDGEEPTSALIAMKGKLYGTTRSGGPHAGGTVFSIDPATGKENVVYSFCSQDNCSDGKSPYSGLTAVNGTLYGTTTGGGTAASGTVFSLKR